jgi:PAS domain-containing protein
MARRRRRPPATRHKDLEPIRARCVACGGPLWVAYHSHRTVTTLDHVVGLRLQVRRCIRPGCPQYHRPYRPEEELGWALPHGEFGLDVIALVGALRFGEHRSVPEIHRELARRELVVAERTVTYLVQRYEELLAVRLSDLSEGSHLRDLLAAQERVILAIDGLQPDVGHEVLWVIRECLSGEILLARSLLSGREAELATLLREVRTALEAIPVPIAGAISDGQHSLRNAVAAALPGVPHQLCHFHYLREAALPVYEADRHAKKELKKQVRGVRPIERALEAREAAAGPAGDPVAAAVRGYCLAVRSALTDDGRPPLAASGLQLRERLTAIHASIARVQDDWPQRGTRAPSSRSPVN